MARKKKTEETFDEKLEKVTFEDVSNDDLLNALIVMDKKINIITNVMLKINEFLDKKSNGSLGIGG